MLRLQHQYERQGKKKKTWNSKTCLQLADPKGAGRASAASFSVSLHGEEASGQKTKAAMLRLLNGDKITPPGSKSSITLCFLKKKKNNFIYIPWTPSTPTSGARTPNHEFWISPRQIQLPMTPEKMYCSGGLSRRATQTHFASQVRRAEEVDDVGKGRSEAEQNLRSDRRERRDSAGELISWNFGVCLRGWCTWGREGIYIGACHLRLAEQLSPEEGQISTRSPTDKLCINKEQRRFKDRLTFDWFRI